jgi:hypothetical protein
MAEDPQQAVQRAAKAAGEVQKELNQVITHLLRVQDELRKDRGQSQAVQELGKARQAARRAKSGLVALDRGLATAARVVRLRRSG